MSPDTYPTDRNRTDAVLDAYTALRVENAGLVDRCAELMGIADEAIHQRDQALAANTILRSR